jgi:putative membrane protein
MIGVAIAVRRAVDHLGVEDEGPCPNARAPAKLDHEEEVAMMWNSGWGWGAWLTMTIVMVGFWGLVAWVIVSVTRGSSGTQSAARSAEDILAERFARGEIDEDEFTQRRDALRSKH